MIARRNLLASALVLGAASVATATAAALPVASRAVQSSLPLPTGVSPRMLSLIEEFTRLGAALDAAEASGDLTAWDRAADARRPALEALIYERPATLMDYAAKMTALAQFMVEEDSERYVLRRLADDATMLAGTVQ
jgi:hypothetical protein